jgi:hypothetical protein
MPAASPARPQESFASSQEPESDVLFGAEQIVSYVNMLLGRNYTADTLYGWHFRKQIPLGKFSNHLVASRRILREHFADITRLPP